MSESKDRVGQISPLLKTSSGVVAERGEGAYIFGSDGSRYLDFTSGIGVTATGHCHPKVVEAAQRQVASLVHGQYAILRHRPLVELAEKLGERMPGEIDRFFFASAGTEACEAAMRLARQATGKPNMIVFQGGFHGRTMGSLSMTTSSVGLRAGVQPMMGGVVVAPFPNSCRYGWSDEETADFCLRELDHILATQSMPAESAAFFVEPVQGEAGYIPAGKRFLQGLRERADRHNMLLILDEVQSGYGRTGTFWAHEQDEMQPDILITAKGLASGFPLSAFGASEQLMSRGWPGSQGGTYGGNAVACAAALATLEVIDEEGLVENAAEQGALLRSRLEALQQEDESIGAVQGRGLMQGTELVDRSGQPDGDRAARVLQEMEKQGVLMIRCGPQGQIVRWLPPLIVTQAEIERAVDAFHQALRNTSL
ncbi:aminotransferase class III-fold pyridoxal phosphate-dependent enzyme [Halorhodospira halochloris]|uniref:aspartate aminotransferase family protein n=1 Tax=Halorhodospira halochloris TaxID=1052 RepID=UPI001EE96085|nr:aminotransferase class III-fold pyridoxal phosphate-dependent enzyme [Halorhodospira halochloris]MCG5530795.1 aminotransferase class III-fold pyridoxal phosphate-dependent enzyme [Halorhodospira halochloris]